MLRSFVPSANTPTSSFPLNNLPYASFSPPSATPRLGVAIGDHILDLSRLATTLPSLFQGPELPASTASDVLTAPNLNALLALSRPAWRELRAVLQDALSDAPSNPALKNLPHEQRAALLHDRATVTLHLPADIGDYTDFYSSCSHASNVGTMFRGPDNALPPNWLHMPIAYHGRASSVVPSGTPVRRPCGQLNPDATAPRFAPCKLLDFELEMAALIGGSNPLGQRVRIEQAGDRVFGFLLMNDWSARDIQKWEYVPLGPFGAKNFATSVSPWVVPLEALEPFKVPRVEQTTPVLPYLQAKDGVHGHCAYDVELQVAIQVDEEEPSVVCESNLRHLYWTVAQQVAHHSVTGCNMRPGDLIASGTISGEDETSFGSMLELSWKGTRKVALTNCKTPTSRTFIQDGDTIYIRGAARGDGYTIGFGECVGKVLPALQE